MNEPPNEEEINYGYLGDLYPDFNESAHVVRQTARFATLFGAFGFRGLTVRGPHMSGSEAGGSFCEVDTTPPNRLLWIPAKNGDGRTIYFHEIDFRVPILTDKILLAYEAIVIGDAAAQAMPLSDIILPILPALAPDRIYLLNSLQLYGCVLGQPLLDAIATFPVHTLILTGYAVAAVGRPCALRINARVRVLMLSVLSRWALQVNAAAVAELDYCCLGGAITTRAVPDVGDAPLQSHELLISNTLAELYTIVEGRKTTIKTLALLIGACDLFPAALGKILESVDRVHKLLLGYNTCGSACPIRTMQHSLRQRAASSYASTLNAPEGTPAKAVERASFEKIFELCGERGIRHFGLDSMMSAQLEHTAFSAIAPYIDSLECEFMVGARGTQHVPLVYSAVPHMEVFRWTDEVLSTAKPRTIQRLVPASGRAPRSFIVDPRLEWLPHSYIVLNTLNAISLPREDVVRIDERTQRDMLRSNPAAAKYLPWPINFV